MRQKFENFEEFWPSYLGEHQHPVNRRLHVVGSSFAVLSLVVGSVTAHHWILYCVPLGYLPAWIGHFVIEKNRPATFSHPLYSLRGDARMMKQTLLKIFGR